MLKTYTACRCKKCNREFVILSEDLSSMNIDNTLTCPYCRSPKIHIEKATDSLKECMNERVYKRVNGALKEIK